MTTLQQGMVNTFKEQFGGPVFEPADAGYDEARQIWNAIIDRKPPLIAQCKSEDDVVAAENFPPKRVRTTIRFEREQKVSE